MQNEGIKYGNWDSFLGVPSPVQLRPALSTQWHWYCAALLVLLGRHILSGLHADVRYSNMQEIITSASSKLKVRSGRIGWCWLYFLLQWKKLSFVKKKEKKKKQTEGDLYWIKNFYKAWN
jgi:hypothetical protein